VIHGFHSFAVVAATMPVMMRLIVAVGIAGAAGKESAAKEKDGRR
jgi:hypothetical protein